MINNPTILLIYAHPEPHHSIANKALISAASELGHVTVHDLYGTYPDFLSISAMNRNCCGSMTSLCFSTRCTPTAVPRC